MICTDLRTKCQVADSVSCIGVKIGMKSQPLRTRMQEGQFTMRKPTSFFLFLLLAVSFLSAFSTSAVADDDPPGRVARLNYIQGSISFQPGGETDWVQANPNRPITVGDNLWADRNSRGELHIGSSSIRIGSETGITFLNLNDRTIQIQLAEGSMNVSVRRLEGGDAFEIDTPNLAFTLQRPGEYRVDVGWAPYRYGHWVWVAPWGWTWVEDEPWGFAPFHYGRWAEVGGGWCWVPGPVVVRPVYAPALVVFVGGPRFGASVSFGGGGGGVAWFPLGPREVYVPPYRTSERYVQKVNVTNTTVNVVNVTNVYNNVNVTNVKYMHQNNVTAVTAVSHDTFVNARPVAAANVRVNAQQVQT